MEALERLKELLERRLGGCTLDHDNHDHNTAADHDHGVAHNRAINAAIIDDEQHNAAPEHDDFDDVHDRATDYHHGPNHHNGRSVAVRLSSTA